MKIKLINYNHRITGEGVSRVVIDDIKLLKSFNSEGADVLEVLFGNINGTIKKLYDLKNDIEYVISLVKACDIQITHDFEIDPKLMLGKVLNIQHTNEGASDPHIYAFIKFSKESTEDFVDLKTIIDAADKKLIDAILNKKALDEILAHKTFENYDDLPFGDDDFPF